MLHKFFKLFVREYPVVGCTSMLFILGVVSAHELSNLQPNRSGHILTQTPNATRNESEFKISRFSMRTKMTNNSQKQPINILKPLFFCLPIRDH